MKHAKGNGRKAKLANKYYLALHADLNIAEIYAGKLSIAIRRERKALDKVNQFDFSKRS